MNQTHHVYCTSGGRLQDEIEIARRFEPPNAKQRWDSPLFHIIKSVEHEDAETTECPLNAISDFILDGKASQASLATISVCHITLLH